MMRGYLDYPDTTPRRAIRTAGRLHTADDGPGHREIVGRKKVAAAQVAVIGVPDERMDGWAKPSSSGTARSGGGVDRLEP